MSNVFGRCMNFSLKMFPPISSSVLIKIQPKQQPDITCERRFHLLCLERELVCTSLKHTWLVYSPWVLPRFVWGALSLIRSNSTFCFRGIGWYSIKKQLAENNVWIFLVPRGWILCSSWTIHKKILKWIPFTISTDIHLPKWSSDFVFRFILILKRLLFCPVKRPGYPTGWQCSWCLLNDWFQSSVSVIKLMGCVMGRPPTRCSRSIVFLVLDQSGSGEILTICQIPSV